MSTGAPVLSVRGLSTEYHGRSSTVRAVDDVSFDVFAGTTMGLVGESGSGKSATAMSITRMIAPSAGRIVAGSAALEGRDIMTMSQRELRATRGGRIGFIPQDPLTSLNPLLTVGEQIAEGVRIHRGASRKVALAKAVDLLDRVGISNGVRRVRDYPHQFSGGMRQRVAIAMAIACDPILLLADEPTTALDVTTQAQILDLLKSLATDNRMATVFITHDLGVAANMCDQICVMYAGQIVERADVFTFFDRPQTPYASGLMAALPSAPADDRGRLVAIPGSPPALSSAIVGCRFASRCPHRRELCVEREPLLTPRDEEGHMARCWGTEPEGWIA